MTTRGQGGGVHFITPVNPGEVAPSTGDDAIDLDHLLGQLYEVGDGKFYRLVKTHGTAFAWRHKVAVWSDDQNWVITPCVSASQRVAGVGDNDLGSAESVAAAAYLLIHVGGPVEIFFGDDHGGAPGVDGEYIVTDDDGDTGKAKGGGSTFTQGKTFARCQEATTDNDEIISAVIEGILTGAA